MLLVATVASETRFLSLTSASTACLTSLSKVVDPAKRHQIEAKKKWAEMQIPYFTDEGLLPEAERMKKLVRDCDLELEEMDLTEKYRRDGQNVAIVRADEEPRRGVRLTDSYFVIKGDHWEIQTVDRNLAGKVLAGASKVKGWGLWEEVVTRILFESGGRVAVVPPACDIRG